MAEIHVAVSISWMGHTNKHTHTHTKNKHDDMLSCCAIKNYLIYHYVLFSTSADCRLRERRRSADMLQPAVSLLCLAALPASGQHG